MTQDECILFADTRMSIPARLIGLVLSQPSEARENLLEHGVVPYEAFFRLLGRPVPRKIAIDRFLGELEEHGYIAPKWKAVAKPEPLDPSIRWHELSACDRNSWPQIAGCYVVIVNGVVGYIGSSKNVAQRLKSHGIQPARYSAGIETPWGHFREVTIKVAPSRRYGDWAMRELRLIRRLQPPFNKVGVSNG